MPVMKTIQRWCSVGGEAGKNRGLMKTGGALARKKLDVRTHGRTLSFQGKVVSVAMEAR
jgi:hypothetical protein